MPASDRNKPVALPSFRSLLLKVNRDLFEISDGKPFPGWASDELSDLEILILILEDRRFFKHFGVDFKSIAREGIRMIMRKKHGGASTIDMQLVRTLTGYRSPTMRRKLYEMLLSIVIQFHYSKIEILRSYLRCAYFGFDLRGIEEAAQHRYGVGSDGLSFEQAAELAAMLVYPHPRTPSSEWLSNVNRRANYATTLFPMLRKKVS